MITSIPMMNDEIGHSLLDKFMKNLFIHIWAMVSEQERNEVNVDKHNVLKSRKTKGYIKAVHYFIRRIVKILKNVLFIIVL